MERRLAVVAPVEIKVESGQDFDGLFRAHYATLTRMVHRVVGDAAWAEEVAAEAFWKLHRKPPRDAQNLAGWLYRTALRLALDHLKKRKRRTHYEARTPLPEAVRTPEESFQQSERRERVRQVLSKLKPGQAALLVLRSEGYTLAEMASVQGLNPASVGTFLARADEAFRKEYGRRYGQL